jgi:hypothetical protein
MKTTSNKERSYGLSPEAIASYKAEFKKTDKIPNPHRNQCYGWIFASLVNLGTDKWHAWDTLANRVKAEATGPKWQAFQRKESRNDETGKDTAGRLFTNALVLQRPDYGAKILDLGKVIGSKGVVIDLRRDLDRVEIRLNTDSPSPLKLGRKNAKAKTETKATSKAQTPQVAPKSPKASKPSPKATGATGKAKTILASKPVDAKPQILTGADAVEFLRKNHKRVRVVQH